MNDSNPIPSPLNLLQVERVIVEDEVSKSTAHFNLTFGDFMGDDALITVARMGQYADKPLFLVQWLVDNEITISMQNKVKDTLHYYLIALPKENQQDDDERTQQQIWDYMIYHATGTAANLYGEVHWAYIDPNKTNEPNRPFNLIETNEKPSVWQRFIQKLNVFYKPRS